MIFKEINSNLVLTVEELMTYTGYTRAYIYQLTHKRAIPYYKHPNGRKLFFKKDEIDNWLLSIRSATITELKEATFFKIKCK